MFFMFLFPFSVHFSFLFPVLWIRIILNWIRIRIGENSNFFSSIKNIILKTIFFLFLLAYNSYMFSVHQKKLFILKNNIIFLYFWSSHFPISHTNPDPAKHTDPQHCLFLIFVHNTYVIFQVKPEAVTSAKDPVFQNFKATSQKQNFIFESESKQTFCQSA